MALQYQNHSGWLMSESCEEKEHCADPSHGLRPQPERVAGKLLSVLGRRILVPQGHRKLGRHQRGY
ncbi:MAG: hypothetical protein JW384_03790 [Nitrosomonadaceae bacterium]|nr:hypothetical protein [Nitrosomonadaceae bacterium]